jgi:hypothetical protein
MDTTPDGLTLLLSDFPSFEAWVLALSERAARARVNHCQHCWHTLVQTQRCCWCGTPRETQHGPYAPEGER